MKNVRITLGGLLLAGALLFNAIPPSAADLPIGIAKPDLKFLAIDEYNGFAWVKITNTGTGASAACELRALNISNGVYTLAEAVNVGSLQPGASVWKLVHGIGGAVRYYKVDYWNVVSESNESNNAWYIPYGPAG